MKKTMFYVMTMFVALLVGCAAPAAKTPAMMKDGMMVDAKGMTLYTFDKDIVGSGKSVCNGDCAVKWPPMMVVAADAKAVSADWSIITRDNGQKQWAFKGKPLYTWPEDQEPGDKYGDNYSKVWHIVK
jgi:predicted lipoprotein with Yx(FWY)xxD motif